MRKLRVKIIRLFFSVLVPCVMAVLLLAVPDGRVFSPASSDRQEAVVSAPAASRPLPAASAGVSPHVPTMSVSVENQHADAAVNAVRPPATRACDMLSATVARQVLGSPVTAADAPAPTVSQDIEATSCAYAYGSVSVEARILLTVRHALTTVGALDNDAAFGSGRPTGVQTVSGYGQAAYWDPTTGELNILADNTWYIILQTQGTPSLAVDQSAVEAAATVMGLGANV